MEDAAWYRCTKCRYRDNAERTSYNFVLLTPWQESLDHKSVLRRDPVWHFRLPVEPNDSPSSFTNGPPRRFTYSFRAIDERTNEKNIGD
jgi:hypothetical protein